MEILNGIIESLTEVLSGKILVVLLVGTGIWFTARLGFVQFREFGSAFKAVFGNIKLKGDKADKNGMSSFQSLATAIAAQVGTGNLAGAATAMVMGGPGAIFWMWISAIFGMATIFAEATLAQKYKTVGEDGEITGGPVYYIRAAFRGRLGKTLAAVFAILITLALGFMGNMVQANSIADSFKGAFGINPIVIGVAVAALSAFVFIGGAARVASITEKIVPIMAAFYILGALVIIVMNYGMIPEAFRQIVVGAWNPGAAIGGFAGVAVSQAVKYGIARGLFSNEAGMGSTPNAHALAKVKHPCDQGMVAMMGVFIDTLVILNLTALVILVTGQLQSVNQTLSGAGLTQMAFNMGFGNFGKIFIAICMFFFAFSTIVGWYFFGEKNVEYLFGPKGVRLYALIVVILIVVGSVLKVELVWNLSDFFNSLMVIPNVLGLLALSGVVSKLYKEWEASKKAGKNKK
ncbi:sodium:alanine symporter family protein [Ruminococcaceae bacterium AM28-23LB]|nr:sodium:alanine symporter family protein [Ruminococcaceae bacterium AM28-23LB]